MGQRDLNQGEIFFDNVRIPQSYVVAGPEAYEALLEIAVHHHGFYGVFQRRPGPGRF
jgi:alkylation response protein AidB-like acyl-CoA dehydrogenase